MLFTVTVRNRNSHIHNVGGQPGLPPPRCSACETPRDPTPLTSAPTVSNFRMTTTRVWTHAKVPYVHDYGQHVSSERIVPSRRGRGEWVKRPRRADSEPLLLLLPLLPSPLPTDASRPCSGELDSDAPVGDLGKRPLHGIPHALVIVVACARIEALCLASISVQASPGRR